MHGGEPTQKKETFSGLFFEEFKERFGIQEYANGEMSRKVLRTRYPSGKVIPHDCYLTERESVGTLFCCMYVQSPARSQSFNAQHCPAA